MSFSRKVGVYHTTLKEVAGSFEVSVKALKATLGSKVSVPDSVTDEQTAQYKRTISAEKCQGLTYVEWQRIERTTITAAEKQWFGLRKPKVVSRIVDEPVNLFVPDTCVYPKPGCCLEDFEDRLSQGFDKFYPISFPQITVCSLARAN